MKLRAFALAALFLAAIVAANLIVAHVGPSATPYVAFGLIGLDLVTRDRLADLWGVNRWAKQAALILAGSALSYAVNQDAAQVAVASCAAFAAAETLEAILYWLVRRRPWVERANIAAAPAALIDSLVFPTVAFGAVLWSVSFTQFVAKVAGAVLWSFVIGRVRVRRAAEARKAVPDAV